MLRNRIGNRWTTVLILIVVFTLLLSGCGTKESKVHRVGILHLVGTFPEISDSFKAKMTELGYIEGQNITYVYQAVQRGSDPDENQRLAKELVDEKVDLILAFPTPMAVAAHAATQGTDTQVVFAWATLEGASIVKSVREPGGNITGVRYPGPEMISRRLEFLIEMAPEIKRVWIGYDANHPNTAPALKALHPAASNLGVTLIEFPATAMEELAAELERRAASGDLGFDAIILMPDGFNNTPAGFGMINDFTTQHKVPLGAGVLSMVEQGALFGNAPSLVNAGELAAPQADKVLKGTPAGTIPVGTPEQDLNINYRVAQELGLTVSQGLLSMAINIIR